MKIVINSKFGGFNLSSKAEEMYLKLKGKKCFFYVQTKYKHREGIDEYQKRTTKEAEKCTFHHTVTKDLGQVFNSDKDINKYYFSDHDIKRDDLDLIKVIKELKNKANNRYSKLKIVSIPDDVEWTIEEYDGNEWIAEKHRTWK